MCFCSLLTLGSYARYEEYGMCVYMCVCMFVLIILLTSRSDVTVITVSVCTLSSKACLIHDNTLTVTQLLQKFQYDDIINQA